MALTEVPIELSSTPGIIDNSTGTAITIDASQNVGINGASGGATLQVNQATASYIDIKSDNALRMRMYGDSNQAILVSEGVPLIFKYGTTEAMRIDSSGNVGINATTIAANGLQIGNTSSTDTEQLFLYSNKAIFSINTDGATNAAGTTIAYSWANGGQGPLKFDNATSTVMTLDASGNVGIGTSSPDGQFESAHTNTSTYSSSTIKNDFIISRKNSSNVANQSVGLQFDVTGWNGSTTGVAGITAIQPSNASSADLAFTLRKDGTYAERMRINSIGNVGIGVTPASDWNTGYTALQIGQGAAIMSSDDTEELFLNMNAKWASDSSWEYIADGAAAVLSMDQATPFKFRYVASGTANTDISFSEAMRIDSSGRLLINKTSSTGSLSLESQAPTGFSVGSGFYSDATQSTIEFKDTNTTANYKVRIGSETDDLLMFAGGAERMRIDASGHLLVGKSSSSTSGAGTFIENTSIGHARINLTSENTTATVVSFYYDNGTTATQVGTIVTSTTTTDYNTSSDVRLKENIVDAPSASDDIDAIQVRSFDWKVDGAHQKYGMVAQELLEVAPSAVSQPEDPEEMMGVDYSKLVPMMLKEIQSLRARVAQLES